MKQIAITLLLCILLHHVVEAKGEKTITVSNVEEFLNAIGKDRTIIMKTGDYVLIEKSDMKGEYYEFTDAYDGKELLIHDVDNLNIMGSDDLTTHLITSPNYGHVIRFKNVNGLKIENIKAGHGPEKGYCTGGVFDFEQLMHVDIVNCNLYGSGTCGLSGRKVLGLNCTKTVIEDCTYQVMEFYESSGMYFEKCIFRNNIEFDLIIFQDCAGVHIKKCIILNNIANNGFKYLLFNTVDSKGILVEKCIIEGNSADYMAVSADHISLKKNKLKNNSFLKGKYYIKE